MDPITIPVGILGAIVALLAFFGKRLLDELKELKEELKTVKAVQAEEKVERTKISGQIDGLKIGANNLAENVRDLKEML